MLQYEELLTHHEDGAGGCSALWVIRSDVAVTQVSGGDIITFDCIRTTLVAHDSTKVKPIKKNADIVLHDVQSHRSW